MKDQRSGLRSKFTQYERARLCHGKDSRRVDMRLGCVSLGEVLRARPLVPPQSRCQWRPAKLAAAREAPTERRQHLRRANASDPANRPTALQRLAVTNVPQEEGNPTSSLWQARCKVLTKLRGAQDIEPAPLAPRGRAGAQLVGKRRGPLADIYNA